MDQREAILESESKRTDHDNQPHQIDNKEVFVDDENEIGASGNKESEDKSPVGDDLEEGEVCSDEEKENTEQDVNISGDECNSKLEQGETETNFKNNKPRDIRSSGNGFGFVENRYHNNRNDGRMRNYGGDNYEIHRSYDNRGGWDRDENLMYDKASSKPVPPPDRLTSAWELGIKQAREAKKRSERKEQTRDSQIESNENRYYKDDHTYPDEYVRRERRDDNYDLDRRDNNRDYSRREVSPPVRRNHIGHSPSDDGSESGCQRVNRRADDWTDPWRRSPFRARRSSGSHWDRDDRNEARRRYSRSYSRDRSRSRSRSRDRYPRSRHRSPYSSPSPHRSKSFRNQSRRDYDEESNPMYYRRRNDEKDVYGDNSHGRYLSPSPNHRRSRSTSKGRYERGEGGKYQSGSRSPSRSPYSGRSRRNARSGHQPNSSKRKEQLLQELKVVEDAIRRKKSKSTASISDKEM